MSTIVVITTPGTVKRDFVNVLQKETNGSVALVIIQKTVPRPLAKRLLSFIKKGGVIGFFEEILYFIYFRYGKKVRHFLELSKLRTPLNIGNEYAAPTMEVASVNSNIVYERLKELQPDVIAVWGGSIIKPYIIETARVAVNIHTGFCPYYRGTNCHFNAILNDDLVHLGTTLHKVVPDVDAGDIFEVITAKVDRSFSDLFRDLNDRSFVAYVNLVKNLSEGKVLGTFPQDVTLGKNYMLKEWTYKKRWETAKKIEQHEARYNARA